MPDNSIITVLDISFSKNNKHETFYKHFLAGALAGAISRTLTAPIDRIKVFFQVSNKDAKIMEVLNQMVKEGGVASLWRGNFMNVVKNTPKQAVRFAVYDEFKRNYFDDKEPSPELQMYHRFLSGSIAGFVSQTVMYPAEMLKVRMSLRTTGKYNGIIDAVYQIYKKEGIMSFGRGYVPSIVAIIPYSGLELAGYETLKGMWVDRMERKLNSAEQFVIGGLSCIIAQVITYPFAMLCVKMQASESDLSTKKESLLGLTQEIIKTEGIKGLYRGLVPNLIKFIPAMGLTYLSYEQVSKLLGIEMS